MKKQLFALIALFALLCFEGRSIEACDKNIKEKTTINIMNNSETRMVQDIKTAYEALSKSNDHRPRQSHRRPAKSLRDANGQVFDRRAGKQGQSVSSPQRRRQYAGDDVDRH